MRNEIIVAALVWLLLCIAYEWRERRRRRSSGGAPVPLRRILSPFGVATLAVALLALLTIWRARDPQSVPQWVESAQSKQDLALCQHYAVGYQQQHHADTQPAWLHCETFMQRDFGSPMPSFYEALASNPSAMASHFEWNATLFPYALEMALFNRSSGSEFHNPDYVDIPTGSWFALVGSVAVLAFVVLALRLLWLRRNWWWRSWLSARAWGWAVLAMRGLSRHLGGHHDPPPAGIPLLAQLRSLSGHRDVRHGRGRSLAAPEAATAGGSDRRPAPDRARPRPLPPRLLEPDLRDRKGDGHDRLESRAYRDHLRGHDTTLLSVRSYEVCNYVIPEDDCDGAPVGFYGPAGTGEQTWLDQNHIDLIYADPTLLANPYVRQTLAKLQRNDWQRVAPADPQAAGWLLLERKRTRDIEALDPPPHPT